MYGTTNEDYGLLLMKANHVKDNSKAFRIIRKFDEFEQTPEFKNLSKYERSEFFWARDKALQLIFEWQEENAVKSYADVTTIPLNEIELMSPHYDQLLFCEKFDSKGRGTVLLVNYHTSL